MPRRDQKGWERGRQMRNWRSRRGGRKAKHEEYLNTRLGLLVDDWLMDQRRRGLTRSDLRVIQTLLGHSRVDTTEIYTFVSMDRVCQAHHAAHPRG